MSNYFIAYKKERDEILFRLDDCKKRIENGALIAPIEEYDELLRELGNLRGAIIDLRGAEPELNP